MDSATENVPSQRSACKSVVAVLMLLLFLTLQVFSASESLHKALHSDAGSPSDSCAIALVSQGHFTQPILETGVIMPCDFVVATLVYVPPSVSDCDYQISVGRGPPSLR